MAIATREGILKQNIENAVQFRWTNDTGASVNVGDIICIHTAAGKRMAAMVLNESTGLGAIADGGIGQILIRGRVNVQKSTSTAFLQGRTVWWDNSASQADAVATCNNVADCVIGMCTAAAATAASHVEVDLNEGPDSYSPGSSSSSSCSSSSSSSSSCSSSSTST